MDERENAIERELIIDGESSIVSENLQAKQFPLPSYDNGEKWVKEYVEQFGTEPSFF